MLWVTSENIAGPRRKPSRLGCFPPNTQEAPLFVSFSISLITITLSYFEITGFKSHLFVHEDLFIDMSRCSFKRFKGGKVFYKTFVPFDQFVLIIRRFQVSP